ncbi:hypothetical protein D3C77_217710 [compost metagenome]
MGGQGQLGTELAAEAGFRADAKTPLHGFTQVVGQCQAEACATVLAGDAGTGLGEWLENAHLGFPRNADACVAHFQAYTAGIGAQAHVDTAETGELECVGQQVADYLPHACGIAQDHGGKLRVDEASELDIGRCIL